MKRDFQGRFHKSGVSGWQILYLEHTGSDRRIFSEEVDPKRSLTHHRGPSEVLSSKSSPHSCISIRGVFVVRVWCAGCKNCSQSSTACSKAGLLQQALLFLKSSCQNPKKNGPLPNMAPPVIPVVVGPLELFRTQGW